MFSLYFQGQQGDKGDAGQKVKSTLRRFISMCFYLLKKKKQN